MAGLYGCFKGRNSDSAAMASGPPDVTTNQEPAEVQEECSGKKKSKFQTFKKFFARKKRKEPSAAAADASLKVSQSTDNVSKASENNTLTRSEKEKGSGSKISLGSKALSHDSVFVSDSSEANEALGASQDSIHGKVKSLQLQLKQAIRLGSPPSLMCVKKAEDAGTMSEDDGLPCSPPEYTTLHTTVNQAQMNSSVSLEGIDSDDEQLSCAASSRAMSPLVVPGDFSLPASPFGCLDNSAAKHKLGLRNKACNRRKPASRLEGRVEGDSAVEEMLTTSMQEVETEVVVEQQQQRTEDVTDHQLKPKVEEEEEEDEVEETEPPQHSRRSLLRDKEEREEGEDESEAEQDVSHGPDTSCPPEPRLSEDDASEHQPLPSSKSSSRASSLDSPRATPEPPAGEREYLLDPPGIVYGAEKKFDSDSTSEEEDDGVPETMEEESSLLQEVLSSLKTPLVSLDVKTEDVFLEMKQEAEGKQKEEAEIEEGEEVKEEEDEKHQPSISYQFTPSCSVQSGQATEEEEEEVVTPSWQEEEEEEAEAEEEGEVVVVEEEVKAREEEDVAGEEEEEEVEDLAVEQFTQRGHEDETQKEDAEEVQPEEEESGMLTGQNIIQAGGEGGEEEEESEGEEEAIELEKEPEVEEEGREKTEEDDEGVVAVEANEGRAVEEAEEAMEEEKGDAEEVPEMLGEAQEEVEVQSEASMQEADEGVVLADDAVYAAHDDDDDDDDDEIPADLGDQGVASVQEEREKFGQSSGDEMEDGEEIEVDEEEEEGEEVSVVEKNQEDEVEANQPDVDEPKQDLERESAEVIPRLDVDPSEATEQASSKPLSLTLPESPSEARSPGSRPTTPSKTSIIHINLISPSSEKAASFFQTPPAEAEPRESVAQSPPVASTEEKEMDVAQEEKEKEEPTQEQDATPPTSAEEAADHQPSSSDQSKVRFTVSPAWQRSQSLSPPSSPTACASPSSSAATATATATPSAEEVEAANKKVELVLSPTKMRSAGSVAAKPQSSATPPTPVKPQTSAAASTEESSPVVEGSNPFGVRLRKTSALLRLSSEEETTEPPVESPAPPTTSKADPPQPVSVKPSAYQPISNKPVVPKKPEVHGDVGGKPKRVSDPAAGRGVSAGSDSPSWISMAKQKQKIYKENSLEEITVKKEEQERKSSLPMYVSSAASREHSSKTAEASCKASQLEISKPSASVEKEAKRALSPPTPVPPQPSRSHPLPGPVAPKPQVPHIGAKQPPQPSVPQRSIPPPTPVPVAQKSPSCTSPLSPSKTATPPKTAPVTSPPFSSSRPVPEKPGAKAAGHSGQTPSPQRPLPSPGVPQDEPPWMALAKKKAKAWSEMPQIVQ